MRQLSYPFFKAAEILFLGGLFLGSFDIFMTLDVGGVTLRAGQLLQAAFICLGAVIVAKNNGKMVKPLGILPLAIWGIFMVIWTPNTHHMAFSIAYTSYLWFSILLIIAAVQLYASVPDTWYVLRMYKLYLLSFFVIALFGIIQFIAGLAGFDLLVMQWWIGSIPRVNGFSYEPSYFATYLIMGWGMFAWMIWVRRSVFTVRRTWFYFLTVTLAIILSSSRMGIAVMGMFFLVYAFSQIARMLILLKVRKLFVKVSVVLASVIASVVVAVLTILKPKMLLFLLAGTGLGDTPTHSVDARSESAMETFQLFLESPYIGYGLGGVWSEIAVESGLSPGEATGMNVTLEALAASGIFGFVFFLAFVLTVIVTCYRVRSRPHCLAGPIAAAGVGFVLIFIILQFNQNILRVYLWNHLAVIAALYAVYRRDYPLQISKLDLKYPFFK